MIYFFRQLKKKNKKIRSLSIFCLSLFVVSLSVMAAWFVFGWNYSTQAAVGINKQINYQGKMVEAIIDNNENEVSSDNEKSTL